MFSCCLQVAVENYFSMFSLVRKKNGGESMTSSSSFFGGKPPHYAYIYVSFRKSTAPNALQIPRFKGF
jgi:hypothetical protein